MLQILNFDKQTFIEKYWQKKTCLTHKAFDFAKNLIDPNELAGLACEEEVEARMISTNSEQSHWSCTYGPFSEKHFANMQNKNWTLLVQAVDHFLPDVRLLKKAFDFLPTWRLDDVMLSYATQGGGVGPHFDYYDVFLIQVSGSREWKIGQTCNSQTPLREHSDMKLLVDFNETKKHVLDAGDMLYIPAGIAHWGTALSTDCVTASIGFRAPSERELLLGAIDDYANQLSEDQRYQDTISNKIDDPYLINDSVTQYLQQTLKHLDKKQLMNTLSNTFALQITEPRHDELFEQQSYNLTDIEKKLSNPKNIKHHPASRFAYRDENGRVTLFTNAIAYPTNLATAKAICHCEYANKENLDLNLILELLNNGSLLIEA